MARRKIDKQALASLIRESKELNNDQKADLLQLLNEQKRYGLVWEQHKEEAEELLTENIPLLIEEPTLRLTQGGESSPNHILIEGDNLHALTTLTYTHEGKVDVIYIDPPYNTGNKDFVYNDSYVDSEDGYRHSKWLSFMEKRLRIAKKLLSDRGVIFISIDDNEQANLKLLCDEVFGEKNYLTSIPRKGSGGRQDSKHFAVVHEYLLVYAKNIQDIIVGRITKNDDTYKCFDADKQRYYKTQLLRKWGDNSRRQDRPNLFYPIYYNEKNGSLSINRSNECDIEIFPMMDKDNEGCWRWGKATMQSGFENGVVEISYNSRKNAYIAYERLYKPEENGTKPYSTWIDNIDNSTGTSLLKDILADNLFGYPKPLDLIMNVLQMASGNKDITILDFFAGSGTTLHATMQLNAEDGGHRQCILVTNNENNICEEVTYERNMRVINGYTTPKGVEVPGLTNNNLRYYKTAFVPREKTAANRHALMNMSTDLLCIKENMYNEQPFEIDGKKMKPEFVRYFVSDTKDMVIIYDPRAVSFVAKALPQDSQKKIMVYVYSDGQYAYNDEFKGKNIELCALPDAIYQALSRVLPPMKEIELNTEQEGAL